MRFRYDISDYRNAIKLVYFVPFFNAVVGFGNKFYSMEFSVEKSIIHSS